MWISIKCPHLFKIEVDMKTCFIFKEFYKNAINCKPVLAALCKLETRMRRLLEVVNQSEEILSIEDLEPEVRFFFVRPKI